MDRGIKSSLAAKLRDAGTLATSLAETIAVKAYAAREAVNEAVNVKVDEVKKKTEALDNDSLARKVERHRNLDLGHKRMTDAARVYFETSVAQVDAGLKFEEEMRAFFKPSHRSECAEEYAAIYDLRLSLLELQRRNNSAFGPRAQLVQALSILASGVGGGTSKIPGLSDLKQSLDTCLETALELQKKKKALAANATAEMGVNQSVSQVEASLKARENFAKGQQDVYNSESLCAEMERNFDCLMNDFEANKSFVLLRQAANMLKSTLRDCRATAAIIYPMDQYIETELPAAVVQYTDEYDRETKQRENEAQRLRSFTSSDRVGLSLRYTNPPSYPALLAGETLLFSVEKVVNMSEGAENSTCMVFLTPFRIMIVPYGLENETTDFGLHIALTSIVRIESLGGPNCLLCFWVADLRQFTLAFAKSSIELGAIVEALRYLALKSSRPFAFVHTVFVPKRIRQKLLTGISEDIPADSSVPKQGLVDTGWNLYDVAKEFQRQGVLGETNWRMSRMNEDFRVCSTYPEMLVMPKAMSDTEIQEASDHRTKSRMPTLSWTASWLKVAIFRASQPKLGVRKSRSAFDEKLLSQLGEATRVGSSTQKPMATRQATAVAADLEKREGYPAATLASLRDHVKARSISLVVFDARPQKNALGNVAKGGGWELAEYYSNCALVFLDIDNIHEVRSSYVAHRTAFMSLVRLGTEPATITPPDMQSSEPCAIGVIQKFIRDSDQFFHKLDADPRYGNVKRNSRWIKHLSLILKGATLVVECLSVLSISALIHCSDGWDRTPELTSLAMLLLDPYYRTIEGFCVLVEKEWLGFGHKFAQRCGLGAPPVKLASKRHDYEDSQRSPVFVQFIDCVFQLVRQFTPQFEFNSLFLADLIDYAHSCRFGTFMGNSVKDRTEAELKAKTMSAWTFVLHPRVRPFYLNPDYIPAAAASKIPLKAKFEVEDLALFLPFYIRWDAAHKQPFSLATVDVTYEDADVWEKYNGRGKARGKPSARQKAVNETEALYQPGENVLAYFKNSHGVTGAEPYPATIVKWNRDGTYHVKFDDGDMDASCPEDKIVNLQKKHKTRQKVCDKCGAAIDEDAISKEQRLILFKLETLTGFRFCPACGPKAGAASLGTDGAGGSEDEEDLSDVLSSRASEEVIPSTTKDLGFTYDFIAPDLCRVKLTPQYGKGFVTVKCHRGMQLLQIQELALGKHKRFEGANTISFSPLPKTSEPYLPPPDLPPPTPLEFNNDDDFSPAIRGRDRRAALLSDSRPIPMPSSDVDTKEWETRGKISSSSSHRRVESLPVSSPLRNELSPSFSRTPTSPSQPIYRTKPGFVPPQPPGPPPPSALLNRVSMSSSDPLFSSGTRERDPSSSFFPPLPPGPPPNTVL